MNQKQYNVIVPRIDKSGPSMLSYDIAEQMKKEGYLVNYYYLNEGGSTKNIPFQCNRIKKFSIFDVFRISGIIHSHTLRPDIINAIISINPKNTTLTTIPSYFYRDVIFDYPKWKALPAWLLWKTAIKRIRIRFCISRRMAKYYERLIPNTEFKIGNNFRLKRENSENDISKINNVAKWIETQRTEKRIVLVFAAGFRPRKNILRLIKEIKCNKELSLLLIGDGPQLNHVLDEIRVNNQEGQFLYCGMVESPREYFKMCDLLVLPSFAEGVPNVVLEAASVGTLSVLSRIGIHRDLEKQGIGITFNHWNFSDFITQVREAKKRTNDSDKNEIIKAWNNHYSGDKTIEIYKMEIKKTQI